jgi:hypothetical protein
MHVSCIDENWSECSCILKEGGSSMPVTSKVLSAATVAVGYITAGALMLVWSGVYYLYQINHGSLTDDKAYWSYGFLATGLVILLIGLLLGPIGQSVRKAEVAAPGVVAGQTVAQTGVPVAPGVVPVVPPGTVIAPGQPIAPVAPSNSPAPPPAAPATPPR